MTINAILKKGTKAERQYLFGFTVADSDDIIAKKFNLFVIGNFDRYYQHAPAPFHMEMILNYIKSYKGEINFLNIAFRGSAKTTLAKLFVCFVLLNDKNNYRKFIKINSKDGANSEQIVTDVYNLIVEVDNVYGDVFEKQNKTKREERMGSFTLRNGVKVRAGTVGKTQRGHVQDAYRPDWIWFDDVEDSESVCSVIQTQKIIKKIDEAIQGMAVHGSYMTTANYISDLGVIENLRKKAVKEMITPIMIGGVPTWNYFTKEKVLKIERDAEDWWGDYMCDPATGNNREFDASLFRKIPMAEVERKNTRRFLTIDSAVKKTESADYTGLCLNFVDSEGNWNIKAWRVRVDSGELINLMFELWAYYRIEKIGLEATTFTMAIEPFVKKEMAKRGVFLDIIPLKHGGINKELRIRGLLPRYRSGAIYHIDGECVDLEAELLRFPKSANDDTMDATAYQAQISELPYSGQVEMGDIFEKQSYL